MFYCFCRSRAQLHGSCSASVCSLLSLRPCSSLVFLCFLFSVMIPLSYLCILLSKKTKCEKPGTVACVCNPSARKAATRGSLELVGLLVYPTLRVPTHQVSLSNPVSTVKEGGSKGMTPRFVPLTLHVHTHTHTLPNI